MECIIKNIDETLIKELELIGYRKIKSSSKKKDKKEFLYVCGKYYSLEGKFFINHLLTQGIYYCKDNNKLFLALAALKYSTDYKQYFTNGEDFILCDRENWFDMYSVLCSGRGKEYQKELDKYYKANVSELEKYLINNESL